jgi:Tol biopolymer transport system component
LTIPRQGLEINPSQLTHLTSSPLGPTVSADGRWVYFTADNRGLPTLWKMTLDGGSVAEVSDGPIELFDLSPDGKWLAYCYRDPTRQRIRVAVEALDGSAADTRFDIEPTFRLRWMPDGQGLAYTDTGGNVRVQPIRGGSPYDLTRVHPGFTTVTFDWSPDSRYLAYTVMANPVDAVAFRWR